jgi:hypothetical protein
LRDVEREHHQEGDGHTPGEEHAGGDGAHVGGHARVHAPAGGPHQPGH